MKDPVEYIADMSVWGMYYALTIRSPISRGILKEIKCPVLPGSCQLITAKDVPGKNKLANFPIPVLAEEKLSYIGQPAAILAGPDESQLEELASKIEILAEEEKPVFADNDYETKEIIASRDIISGDPYKILGEGGVIVSGTYVTGIQEHWYPEPHGALAVPEGGLHLPTISDQKSQSGGLRKTAKALTVYTATQWPFHVRRSVCDFLAWDDENVTVTPTLMTPHLDGKIWYPSLMACHAALAALITGKPVKLILTREEDFLFTPKRNNAKIEMCSALGREGSIGSSIIQIQLDLGAEGVLEDEIIDFTCLGSLGTYNHEAYKIDASAIRTNIPPQGPMAGFGISQGFFAAERHFSHIADTLGQDPAEWRKKNFLEKNQNLAIGFPLKEPVPLVELIDAVAFKSDYYRKWAAYELLRKQRRGEKWDPAGVALRGIGISTSCQGNGFLYSDESENGESVTRADCAVEMTLDKDGFLEIKTSVVSSGSRNLDSWLKLAQEILGVDPSLVKLTGNTGEAPDSGPGTLSRNIGSITRLVERCCTDIRNQRFRSPLPITVTRTTKPGKIDGWIPGKKIIPEAFAHPGWGAAVAEIEIDPVSLEPVTRGIWLVVDGGKILNERRARRTLQTGIIQALGWTCREKLCYDQGKIPIQYYRSYDVPSPGEIPPIKVDFFKSYSSNYKGIGDLPFSCVPAAYVQAVSQAMDHHFEKIPLDVKDIWKTFKLKQTEPSR